MAKPTAEEFLSVVRPALDGGDAEALACAVADRWSARDICCLLGHRDADVRATVVVTLGIVGDRSVVGCLIRCLHDNDVRVNQFAEDALWSIWFRIGNAAAYDTFHQGVMALADDDWDVAISAFEHAVAADPEFAEAYNQLAIAHYLSGDWNASIEACRKTLALMPTHFGAMAGLGHCYAHVGKPQQAIDCYRRALSINPRMAPIREAMRDLQAEQGKSGLVGEIADPMYVHSDVFRSRDTPR